MIYTDDLVSTLNTQLSSAETGVSCLNGTQTESNPKNKIMPETECEPVVQALTFADLKVQFRNMKEIEQKLSRVYE